MELSGLVGCFAKWLVLSNEQISSQDWQFASKLQANEQLVGGGSHQQAKVSVSKAIPMTDLWDDCIFTNLTIKVNHSCR